MDLSHRSVDTPLGAQYAPALDELTLGFFQLHGIKVEVFLKLSIITESNFQKEKFWLGLSV